ncbi:MAG: replicative DNA helicase [Treponema sp.]|jgi:replicative DNA helicase|nr:replicative DNA helicase [Treponema sp.]
MAQTGPKDRIPPHNEDAERAVLGGLMLDDEAIITAELYLRAGDFYSNANRRVFEAIQNLKNEGRKADIITAADELRRTGQLEAAGDIPYISSLTSVVPTAANIDYYAKIVKDCSIRRSLIRLSGGIITESYDESRDSRLVLEETQQRIFELTNAGQTLSYKSVKEIITRTIEAVEKLYYSKSEFTGIPSGFEDLDSITSGFQPAELVIIGARPSIGKTALALAMAANISIRSKIPAAFFTLEMPDQALVLRIISSEANIESQALRAGSKFLKPSSFNKLVDAAGKIYDAPLYIVDMPNMKLLDLRTQARRLRSQEKVEIIFIDYLTLISTENYQIPRHEQVAEISRSLKSLARELGIPIVALSQLSREVDKRTKTGPGRPVLADLRESGSIEQDADMVLFLHRERETDKEQSNTDPGGDKPTELIVAKNRNGPTGIVNIRFLSKFTKFVSVDKHAGQ